MPTQEKDKKLTGEVSIVRNDSVTLAQPVKSAYSQDEAYRYSRDEKSRQQAAIFMAVLKLY